MKKVATLVIALALIHGLVAAQTRSLTEFQDKYREMDKTTFVDISGSLFNFVSGITNYVNEDDEDKEDIEAVGRILGNIKAMQVLDVPFRVLNKSDITSLKKNMGREKFEPLMSVKEQDSKIDVLAQGSGAELKNITFLIDSDDSFVLLTFQGTFSMEDVSYLAKNQKNWR